MAKTIAKHDMRLIDANDLLDEVHLLLVFGALKEQDYNTVVETINKAPTIFNFKIDRGVNDADKDTG